MRSERRSVSVLGSTGSIGTSTIDLLLANPDRFRVRAVAGGRNVALLAQQARALGAELAVIAERDDADQADDHREVAAP